MQLLFLDKFMKNFAPPKNEAIILKAFAFAF